MRLSEMFRADAGYAHAVVLTEHRYSARRRYQIIVPLVSFAEYELVLGDLVVTDKAWLRKIPLGRNGVILGVDEIRSIYHRDGIESWTGAVMDEGSLRALEAAVIELFEL